jgi:hypothetical protein
MRALIQKQTPTCPPQPMGIDHPVILTIVNILALGRGCRGEYKAAEELHQQALATRDKLLGPEQLDTERLYYI